MATTEKDRKELKVKFLEAYSRCGSLHQAATLIGIKSRQVSRWRERDDEFAEAVEDAKMAFLGILESTAFDRAKESSDSLLQFLLRANDPMKYNPNLSIRAEAQAGEERATVVLQFSSDMLNDEEVALLGKAIAKDKQSPSSIRSESTTEIIPQIKGEI